MPAYSFMSTDKIKSLASFTRKMNHNYRLNNVPNADPNKRDLNQNLITDFDNSVDKKGNSYTNYAKEYKKKFQALNIIKNIKFVKMLLWE